VNDPTVLTFPDFSYRLPDISGIVTNLAM